MNRRELFARTSPVLTLALASALPGVSAAQEEDHAHHHDHAAMTTGKPEGPVKTYADLLTPFQSCTAAVAACISHCQILLAKGDKSMGACLRTALDCDVTCNAVLRAAGLSSAYTPALARTAIDAMKACAKACYPHIEHHAECKACHEACLAAIDAARKVI